LHLFKVQSKRATEREEMAEKGLEAKMPQNLSKSFT